MILTIISTLLAGFIAGAIIEEKHADAMATRTISAYEEGTRCVPREHR